MIRDQDVRYHTPSGVTYDWGETTWFSVYVPEANVTAWVYIVARPGVGAMMADVEVIDGIGRKALDARYFDMQQHLPIPERFEEFALPNGLAFKATNIRDYQIDYVGVDDTELHWTARGVMEPYDINDPAMDPLASGDVESSGFGSAYANHFDMTAHVTGTLKVRGVSYKVDCVTTMDHSWGPRNERHMRPMGWINANFDKDNAFSTIWSFDPFAKDWDQFKFAHGYALIDGEVYGLKAGRQRAIRHGVFPVGYEMIVTDKRGTDYTLVGQALAQIPWSCYSNTMAIFTTTRWMFQGREGVGLAQENFPLDRLTGKGLG